MESIVRTSAAALKRLALCALLLLSIAPAGWAGGSGRLPAEFALGVRVSIKGEFEPDGVMRAREVEIDTADADEELRGQIESIDTAARTISLLGFVVSVPESSRLRREPDDAIGFSELAVGQRVKVSGQRDAAGVMIATSIRVRSEAYPERRYVGLIEEVGDAPEGDVTLVVLGRRVRITERTELTIPGQGPRRLPVRARVASADDDLLLLGNIRPFPGAAISGELRPRGEILRNRDLDDTTRDAEIAPELLAILGGLARFGPLDVYAEVSARRQFFLDGGPALGAENEKNLLSLSQLYIRYQRARGEWWWRLQVGRQRLTDPRQWYIYTKNLDTAYGLAGHKRWSIEAAYGRALFNKQHFKSEQSRDNLLLRVSYALTHEVELSAFLLDRSDRTAVADSPRLFGVRAYGDIGRYLEFWVDRAWERGERGLTDDQTGRLTVVPIQADAYDIGATFRPRWPLDPSVTASIAHGSGGDDEAANLSGAVQTAGTFRQSGFERNKGSYNGVVSFSYYGEVLDPELANLNVKTLGLGLRPLRSLSFDLVYHDYKQDVLSRRRIHGSPVDAKPNGLSSDLGTEWDVVIGYEPSRLLELRVTAGRFRPGAAYELSHEVASIFTFQTKFRF